MKFLAAALCLVTVVAHADDFGHRIAALKTEDERACVVAEAGYSPALRDGLSSELMRQRRVNTRTVDVSLALFLEQLGREQHDEKAIAHALAALGVIEETARHWPAAEALYQEAAAHARNCGDDYALADAMFGLSFVCRGAGYADAVLPALVEARAAARRAGSRDLYPLIVNTTAIWKRLHGDLDESIADFKEVRSLMEAAGDLEGVAGVTNNLGSAFHDLGDTDQAIEAYQQALTTAEKIRNNRIVAYALNNLGEIYLRRREFGRAEAVFQRSRTLKETLGDASESSSELNLGEIARLRHRSLEAFHWYARGLADAAVQPAWKNMAGAERFIAQLALDDGRPHVALDFATRAAAVSKAHDIVSVFIAATSVRGHALQMLGRTAEARTAFDDAIAAIEQERMHAGGPEPQRALFLEQRLDPYFGAVSLLCRTKPAEALAYAEKTKARVLLDLLHGEPIDANGPVRLARDEAALEFVTAESKTFVFVVTGSRVRGRRIALAGAALADEVRTLRAQIAQRDLRADTTSARLFRRLIGDVWPLVRGYRHLIIVPDGALWELPFAALVTADGRYLVEHAAVTLAPSLAARAAMHARATRREAAPLDLLAFGSALPEAEAQARQVAALYGNRGRSYSGDAATETRFKNEIADARFLHIATHGVLNDANPMYSHLLLGADARNDGLINAREIVRLHLRSELAVLSACETARGRTYQGEGVVGLAWAFFLAGCPSTVVSQWSVDATSTTSLMLAFHRQLRDGATKSDALRDAALKLLRDPKSRHPFYWAAFVLIGDDSGVGLAVADSRPVQATGPIERQR